jgi:ferredoxin-like protein FixX
MLPAHVLTTVSHAHCNCGASLTAAIVIATAAQDRTLDVCPRHTYVLTTVQHACCNCGTSQIVTIMTAKRAYDRTHNVCK